MVVFLQRACRVKELLWAEHCSIFPVVALKESESNGRLSSAHLPRQGNALGGTKFQVVRPVRIESKGLSFFIGGFSSVILDFSFAKKVLNV
jgi:hypothetical protein